MLCFFVGCDIRVNEVICDPLAPLPTLGRHFTTSRMRPAPGKHEDARLRFDLVVLRATAIPLCLLFCDYCCIVSLSCCSSSPDRIALALIPLIDAQ